MSARGSTARPRRDGVMSSRETSHTEDLQFRKAEKLEAGP